MVMFSIIATVYKVAEQLDECVESILVQTHRNFELILVVDEATDGCPEMCDMYAQKDNRIKALHKEKGSLSEARNAGIGVARGDYIIFIDGDDYWDDRDALSAINEIIAQRGVDVVLWGNKVKDEQTNYILLPPLQPVPNNEMEKSKPEVLRALVKANRLRPCAWGKAIKRTLYVENDLYFGKDILYVEDVDWTARVMICADKIALLNEVFYVYRRRPGSLTKIYNEKRATDYINQVDKCCELIQRLDGGALRDALNGYAAVLYYAMLAYLGREKEASRYLNEARKRQDILDEAYTKREIIANKFRKIIGLHLTVKLVRLRLDCLELLRHSKNPTGLQKKG